LSKSPIRDIIISSWKQEQEYLSRRLHCNATPSKRERHTSIFSRRNG
jgi:hypothetical protein